MDLSLSNFGMLSFISYTPTHFNLIIYFYLKGIENKKQACENHTFIERERGERGREEERETEREEGTEGGREGEREERKEIERERIFYL